MSVNAFALHIGLPRSENLYQIKKGNHGISKVLAETIHRFYPNYSIGWLLSGEGPAKRLPEIDRIELGNETFRRIPIYNRLGGQAKPAYHTFLSEDLINGSGLAVVNRDESLFPRVPVGSLVFLKPTDHIFSGKFYMIVTAEFTMIRKVRVIRYPDELRLETIDRQNYDDIVIDRQQIEHLYSVEKIIGDI